MLYVLQEHSTKHTQRLRLWTLLLITPVFLTTDVGNLKLKSTW